MYYINVKRNAAAKLKERFSRSNKQEPLHIKNFVYVQNWNVMRLLILLDVAFCDITRTHSLNHSIYEMKLQWSMNTSNKRFFNAYVMQTENNILFSLQKNDDVRWNFVLPYHLFSERPASDRIHLVDTSSSFCNVEIVWLNKIHIFGNPVTFIMKFIRHNEININIVIKNIFFLVAKKVFFLSPLMYRNLSVTLCLVSKT